jgi:hypothetical protein
MRLSADLTEGLALVAIAVALTVAGHALLRELRAFEPAAIVLFGFGIFALSMSMRRVLQTKGADSRLVITVRAAYLTALVLAILAVVFPARWSAGSAIAMADIAIVFDLFTRVTKPH